MVNTHKSFTVNQIPVYASCLISDFHYLRLEVLFLGLEKIRKGQIETKGVLDYALISRAVMESDNEYMAQLERVRHQEHIQNKTQVNDFEMDDEQIKEFYKKVKG